MFSRDRRYRAAMFVVVTLALAIWSSAGNLNPPIGPVSPTMKALDVVEPRTPISSLPFTINSSGSYYVARDLTGGVGQSGITINASDVTVDLCGFALRGVPGSINGIFVASPQTKIHIRDGIVCNWGGVGIMMLMATHSSTERTQSSGNSCGSATGDDTDVKYCLHNDNAAEGLATGARCTIISVAARLNGTFGIQTGADSNVSDSNASGNTGNGFSLSDGCTITNCTANGNGGVGIFTPNGPTARGSTITACTASNNTGNGIAGANGSIVSNCSSTDNDGDGIVVGMGCTVSNCSARANLGDGIEASSNCRIVGNDSTGNGPGGASGAGIHIVAVATGGVRIDSNNVTANDRGIDVDAAANVIIKNTATANGTNYDIVAGNTVGEIIAAAANANFISTNCWANLTY